jgi:hypothetical protein
MEPLLGCRTIADVGTRPDPTLAARKRHYLDKQPELRDLSLPLLPSLAAFPDGVLCRVPAAQHDIAILWPAHDHRLAAAACVILSPPAAADPSPPRDRDDEDSPSAGDDVPPSKRYRHAVPRVAVARTLPWRLRCALWATSTDSTAHVPLVCMDEAAFSLLALDSGHVSHISHQIALSGGAPFLYLRDVFMLAASGYLKNKYTFTHDAPLRAPLAAGQADAGLYVRTLGAEDAWAECADVVPSNDPAVVVSRQLRLGWDLHEVEDQFFVRICVLSWNAISF